MIFTPASVRDAVVIDAERHSDARGYMARTYCAREFAEHGLDADFVQASTVFSPPAATLRGLHFQQQPFSEAKLIRCTRGAAWVAIVDLRLHSPTHLEWCGYELSPENGRSLYVPEGFAQGYRTLVDETELAYQMSHVYVPEAASGLRWDDPAFAIEWPAADQRLISIRDQSWPDYRVAVYS